MMAKAILQRLHVVKMATWCKSRYYSKTAETELLKQLKAKIKLNGPITVSEYMKEVLTNPTAGYYMNRDVFGSDGDFITSPEISQIFGELIGIWCVNEWYQNGSPKNMQVVELGPGRGTLADDMLRVFSKFDGIRDALSLHLIEVSPKLSQMQREKLSGEIGKENEDNENEDNNIQKGDETENHHNSDNLRNSSYKHCSSKYGPDVFWYRNLGDVPRGYSFYIAHEFLDALPIHKFQKKDNRWHEILIDVDESDSGEHHLRYVLSPGATTSSQVLLQVEENETREHIELSPESGIVTEILANRIKDDGGFALIADYGHNGNKMDTFRAFKQHKLHDVLCEPGTADLTADVDFSYLQRMCADKVSTFGPIAQGTFLHNMGIGARMQVLMKNATTKQRKNLVSGYDMLTNPEKMGERFKFFAMLQKHSVGYVPAGFKDLQ